MTSELNYSQIELNNVYVFKEEKNDVQKYKTYRTPPFIVTIWEGALTSIDIKRYIENGLHIVRFRSNLIMRKEKLLLLNMLEEALRFVCNKYGVEEWPIALCLDLPSIMVRTGSIVENENGRVQVATDSTITLSNRAEHWNRGSSHLIYMNDHYVMDDLRPGVEITLRNSHIVLIVKQRIDSKSVACKVERGGVLMCYDFLCVRDIKFKKPSITENDLEIIDFAKEFKADMLTIHSVRYSETIRQVRALFKGCHVPLILSDICEAEGLENIDSIIKESDAIILSREFLFNQIADKNKLVSLQLHIGGKCKQVGKPFFLAGGVMWSTLMTGVVTPSDISDVTNAIMQGAGFVLSDHSKPEYVQKAIETINSVCMEVESLGSEDHFKRMFMELRPPVSAAEACIISCALIAKQTGSPVIVLPTVTGRTAVQLAHMAPEAINLSVTTNPDVARMLLMYKGSFPVIYLKPRQKSWTKEMVARIDFALGFGLNKEVVRHGDTYVILRKSSSTSAYCDHVSTGVVFAQKFEKRVLQCDFEVDIRNQISYDIGL